MAEDAHTTYQGFRNLSAVEQTIYEAARAKALADRWRIDAEISEQRGEPAALARENQRVREAEADDGWEQKARLKQNP